MPRPDGTLYNFEKRKLHEEANPKPAPVKRPPGRPKKPVELRVLPEPKKPREPHPCSVEAWDPVNKGGRPVVNKRLERAEVERVIAEVRQGLPLESALVLVGINRGVVDKWKARNPLLQLEFAKAEAEFESEMVRRIAGFATSSERSAQWLLERRASSRWAAVSKQELTGKDGGPVQALAIAKHLLGNSAVESDADRAAKAKPVAPARAG